MDTPIQDEGATESACGKISYDSELFHLTMDGWVQAVHRNNALALGWTKSFPLKRGAYGYDNLVLCIHDIFHSDIGRLEEDLADMVHESWIRNYVFWRDNKPWETSPHYGKPFKDLGDVDREKSANTKYCDLSEEEKEKDRIIVRFLVEKARLC